jgi:hypothetical protein
MAAAGVEGRAVVRVQAPPEQVYALVADVTRMGDRSPETHKAEWIDGATGPAVGARFKGHNKLGIMRWSTTPTVKVADVGREFMFETGKPGKEATRWRYRLVARGGGTELSEEFEALRYGWFSKLTAKPEKRVAKLTGDIQATLERIKAAAEHSSSPSGAA